MEAAIHGRRSGMIETVLIAIACGAAAAVSFLIYGNYKERKLLTRLNQMLEDAIAGDYQEEVYDESILSSVEAKMARFLGSSKLSRRQMEKEQDKIKTLISDISHQTKTPVANIRLFSELLLEMELPERARQAAEELNGQAGKLQFLIETLVKMSRMENGIIAVRSMPCPVERLMEEAFFCILPQAAEKEIEIKREPADFQVSCDLKWTSEALYNLLDNAVKYTPRGGRITIRAISYELFGRIDVEDNGIGITETEQAKIFTRFYRSPEVNQTEGIGVGLYLVREIISSQGGYVRVRSEIGKGSVFSIYLPTAGG